MANYSDSSIVEGLHDIRSFRCQALITTATSNILTLTSSSELLQVVTNGSVAQTLVLPNATTLQNGHNFKVWNNATLSLTVKDGSSATLITLNPGQRSELFLIDNSTVAGVWIKDYTSNSPFAGVAIVGCTYNGSANTGRYLEFFTGNGSDVGPFVVIASSVIVAMTIVSTLAATGTVSVYKTTDLTTPIASISVSGASSGSVLGLNAALTPGDKLAVKVSSGSFNKPGVYLYMAGT